MAEDIPSWQFTTDPTAPVETVNVVPQSSGSRQIKTVREVVDGNQGTIKTVRSSAVSSPTFRTVAVVSSAAAAVIAAMSTPPSAARAGAITTLVNSLQASGVWDLLDVLYVLAAADSQAALLNWKAPASFTASAVNSPTFTADRGFTGNGTTSRVNTGWVPSTNGVKYTQNSASAWLWSNTEGSVTNGDLGGKADATKQCLMRLRSVNSFLGRVNDADSTQAANGGAIGFFGMQRISSTTKNYWKNGAQLGTNIAANSVGVNADAQWICGCNATGFPTNQQALAAWGASLAGKEAAFYNAVLTYMQAVGNA